MATRGLNWDDLRYFLRAAETKSLAGAARAMGVEHSTVGRRLAALEVSLGAALVLRGSDGLHLTPLGEALVPLAEDVERAVSAVAAKVAAQRTRVRLAVPSGFTQLFSTAIAQLAREHPSVSLEIVSGARPVDLKRGEADIAIRSGPIRDQDLVVRKLGEAGFSLYAAAPYLATHGRPLDLDDLSGHKLIGYDESLAGMPAAQWVERRAHGASIVLRSREMTDMVSAALGGVGLAVLPCSLADAIPELVRVTRAILATRTLSLVYRREAGVSPDVRAVIALVVEVMRQNAERIRGR